MIVSSAVSGTSVVLSIKGAPDAVDHLVRKNFATNPSFETSATTGWICGGVWQPVNGGSNVQGAGGVVAGSKSLELTFGTTGSRYLTFGPAGVNAIAVKAGDELLMQFDVRNTGQSDITLGANYASMSDPAGATLPATPQQAMPKLAVGESLRISQTHRITSDGFARPNLFYNASAAAGASFAVDAILLQVLSVGARRDYFDGSMPSASVPEAFGNELVRRWTGTSHGSASEELVPAATKPTTRYKIERVAADGTTSVVTTNAPHAWEATWTDNPPVGIWSHKVTALAADGTTTATATTSAPLTVGVDVTADRVTSAGGAIRLTVKVPAGTTGTMTIWRDTLDGPLVAVLGAENIPAADIIIDDALAPLNRPIYYRVDVAGVRTTVGPVTISAPLPVLSNPYTGDVAAATISKWQELTHARRTLIVPVEGARTPYAISDVELSATSDTILRTDTGADLLAFRDLVADGSPLYLRAACPGVEDTWFVIMERKEQRLTLSASDHRRHHALKLQHLDAAPGGSRRAAADTLGDLAAAAPGTLAVIAARWPTLGAIAADDLKALA